MASLLSILVVDMYRIWKDDDEQEKHIQTTIWSLMRAKKDNFINDLYKEDAVDEVVHNCLQNYCIDLADSYFNYIKHNVNIFRTEMTYNVEVLSSDLNFCVSQEISYRKNFKVKEDLGQYYFKCYFALRPGALEKRLNESDWFFREEITDQNTINKLIKETQHEIAKICDILKLKLFIDDIRVPLDKINMEIDEDGISFIVYIPKQNYTFTTNKDTQNLDVPGYVSYKAKVCCKIMNQSRNFYCVFTEPTISPSFSIKFPNSIPIESVNRVSCLTLPNTSQRHIDESTLIVNSEQFNCINFNVANGTTIFPRSGIYFNW
jgi:hypothetical protein